MKHIHLAETTSTMQAVRDADERLAAGGVVVVSADYQTSGRGQRGNSWESEHGQNLLFSMAFCPVGVQASRQFMVSEALSVAIVETVRSIAPSVSVTVKWPNDIYIGDCKVAGILIEHDLQGGEIRRTIAGVGLNVNQMVFRSDAPNPVSLRQVLRQQFDCKVLLDAILGKFFGMMGLEGKRATATSVSVHATYMELLYRRKGLFPYRAGSETFMAEIADVSANGTLLLRTADGKVRQFGFKEVEFVIKPNDKL